MKKCASMIAVLAFLACGGRATLEGEPKEREFEGPVGPTDTAGVGSGGRPEAEAPPAETNAWLGEIGACCWRDSGCSNDEICVAGACWLPSAGCWADENCPSGYHCEGANPCSCCETCRCTGPDTAGTCVLNACTVATDSQVDASADDCDELERLALGSARIADEGGDGEFSAGERATVTVTVHETSGYSFDFYPGMQLEVDPRLASVSAMNWRYSQGACESYDYSATVEFSGVLEPGTRVVLTSRVAALGVDCPDSPSTEISVVIAP